MIVYVIAMYLIWGYSVKIPLLFRTVISILLLVFLKMCGLHNGFICSGFKNLQGCLFAEYSIILIHVIVAGIDVAFSQSEYSANENDGYVEMCVEFSQEGSSSPSPRPFSVSVIASDISAGMICITYIIILCVTIG